MSLVSEETKITAANVGAILFSLTDVIDILRVFVLVVTIIYTGYKVVRMMIEDWKKHFKEQEDNNEPTE